MAVFICQACGVEHSAEDGKCPECGATQTIRLRGETADRMIDRVIKGKYKILKKLGQGGMGAVYLSEQLGIGHKVALKFLKSEFSADVEIARRFLNEAKSYARVAHPNAVTLHDFGQDEDGNLFIAMEYCEGVDLKKVISEQRQLPVGEAIEIVLQVADVLANAHSKGVVHRDLKPENIMIRRGMRGVHAKVLDFGIARLMDAGTRLTVAGAIAGTPRYMSPEQVEGREADLRADIYALGIVLYECLTGVQPFDGNTIAEILRRQVSEPMPTLSKVSPELEFPQLDAVIQKATSKRREERFTDMLAFADALSNAIPPNTSISGSAMRASVSRIDAAPGSSTSSGGSATSASGMAPPGAVPTDLEMTGATMVKSPTPVVGQVSPSLLKAGLGTELEGRVDLAAANASIPPIAPKSKVPMVTAGAAGLFVIALAAWAFAPSRTETKTIESPVVVTPHSEAVAREVDAGLLAAVIEPAHVDPADSQLKIAVSAAQIIANQEASSSVAAAGTDFELANLDAAEIRLRRVAEGTTSYEAAQTMLKTITRIRDRLAVADRLRGRGDCPSAAPVYREVLALNSRVAEAIKGAAACKNAAVDTTMEP